MFNHVRTLLRNRHPSPCMQLLEELVPEDYTPVVLPPGLAKVWSALFGLDPDLPYLDQQLQQLLALAHAGPLAEHLFHHDTRITYDPARDHGAVTLAARHQLSASPASPGLLLTGTFRADETRGRSNHSWTLVLKDDLLVVTQQSPDSSRTVRAVQIENGYDVNYALQRELFVRVPYAEESWSVRGDGRSRRDVSQVMTSLRSAGTELAGILAGDEPYRSFRNCWNSYPVLSQRLVAVALALAYRLHELRGQ